VVGGEEDGIGDEAGSRDRLYTTPEDLLRVAGALGTGARGRYLLAATFGNVHGVYAPGQVTLRPQILADGQAALSRVHAGARFRYVFHGSSGSSPEELRAAVDHGVVKVDLDSETQYAFTRAAAEHMIDHRDGVLAPEPALGDKRAYDPPRLGRRGRERDGRAGGAGVRAARLSGTEHRRLIKRRGPCPAHAAAMAVRR
jgi:fructose-bisphosphate aldolase, class II